ncbi:RidA family protein [Lachnoclostridium edouardi]|uniref:RidA family protein n=1 Tax=Lachnoclostridium edouardi TaxID=1926283 RepID=UPI000C7CE568|nr:RidA family protein [Lachnoclostridium edouardi]
MKKVVSTEKAPAALGPYSQANIVGNFVFTSGMVPINPADNSIPADVKTQAAQSLNNIKAVLEAAGSSMDKVFKTTVFIKNMNDFAQINEVYATFFDGNYPSRSCVEVARLPKDVLVEIEAIATLD